MKFNLIVSYFNVLYILIISGAGIENLIPDPEPEFGYRGKSDPDPDPGQLRSSPSKSGRAPRVRAPRVRAPLPL